MKKRILSLVLAIAMCVTVFTTAAVAEVELMGGLRDDMGLYIDRAWDWQEGQFDAMTDEQKAIIANAYANYETRSADIEAIALSTAEQIVANGADVFLSTETMKNLYKWKLMRDMMEGKVDISLDHAGFADWLDRFTAFEQANDEAISAANPNAALNGLGEYSDNLTVYFEELMLMYYPAAVGDPYTTVSGADQDKFKVYAAACGVELGIPDITVSDVEYKAYLKADVTELIKDGMLNVFDIGIKVACGEKVRGDAIFEDITDRTMKSAFLLLGEDFVRYYINIVPTLRSDLLALNKKDMMVDIIRNSNAPDILSADNTLSFTAMYQTMSAVSEYIEGQSFAAEPIGKIESLGFDVATCRGILASKLMEAMGVLDNNHGVELVHLNAYMGRALLNPENGYEIEVEAGTTKNVDLYFAHKRYGFVEEALGQFSIEQFDALADGEGISVVADDEIGVVKITADENAAGSVIKLDLYRGYNIVEATPGAYDAYRYVTTYTVKVTGDVETPYVDLYDIADTTADGTILVKGTTNLDYVTVSIVKDDSTIYAVVYTRTEFENGITLNVPDNAQTGDVYTVVVGTDRASDSTDFTIVEAPATYNVVLNDIADTTADGTILVKGTTNLNYVTVSIVKGDSTIYAVVYTKAEFEAGITLNVPDNARIGDVYTVVVGTDRASDSTEFTIVEPATTDSVTIEDIADFKLSEQSTITVKGTTTLNHVTVTIVKGDDTIYAVVYTKAEFENGITLNVPDNAQAGDVYTVVVGTDRASASDTFTILPETVTPPSLALAGNATITVTKGNTRVITTTPQNIPAGSTAEVRWTTEDGTIVEITQLNGDYNNLATIKTLKKGTTTLTATLYVDGVATNATVTITVKVTSGGGGGGSVVVPTEPTEPSTGDIGTTHTCQWPDIAATGEKPAHWAHETIDQMTINGYINGFPDGTFKPDQNITRAEFSAIVYRILGLQKAENGIEYADTVGHWAEDIIATMSLPEGYDMLRGYGDGNFGPDDNITREQAVAIIARAKSAVWVAAQEGAKDVFTDAEDISWWFDGEIDAAVTNGLITGYEDGSYRPLNFTTRAEACTLLARAWPEVLE